MPAARCSLSLGSLAPATSVTSLVQCLQPATFCDLSSWLLHTGTVSMQCLQQGTICHCSA